MITEYQLMICDGWCDLYVNNDDDGIIEDGISVKLTDEEVQMLNKIVERILNK